MAKKGNNRGTTTTAILDNEGIFYKGKNCLSKKCLRENIYQAY